jgi:hypothetical protein
MNTSAKDARALLAVKLGDGQPLVPAEAQAQGSRAIVAAALRKFASMKRPRAPVVYHRAPGRRPEKGPLP